MFLVAFPYFNKARTRKPVIERNRMVSWHRCQRAFGIPTTDRRGHSRLAYHLNPALTDAELVGIAKIAAEPRLLWTVPEAFASDLYEVQRFPPPEEERIIVYSEIGEGSKGIWYYARSLVARGQADPGQGILRMTDDDGVTWSDKTGDWWTVFGVAAWARSYYNDGTPLPRIGANE